jgi:hypothetical protein
VPHAFAGAFHKTRRIGERRAVEEADVHVSLEGVDVSKRGVFHAGDGVAIVHELTHVGPATAHVLKPRAGDASQFVTRLGKPRVDFWGSMDRTGEPKEFAHLMPAW